MGLEGLAAIPLGLIFLVSGLLTNLLEVRSRFRCPSSQFCNLGSRNVLCLHKRHIWHEQNSAHYICCQRGPSEA